MGTKAKGATKGRKSGQPAHAEIENAAVETAPVEAVAEVVAPASAGSRKIEKIREEKNGVKRPSAGGLCRAVWDFCDSKSESGTMPTVAEVKLEATARGWNPNNASIEYYQWRKFTGVRGRQAKPTVTATDAAPSA